jgi:hypothetical protein
MLSHLGKMLCNKNNTKAGDHKFSENLGTTSKLWVPEGYNEKPQILGATIKNYSSGGPGAFDLSSPALSNNALCH